MPDSERATVVQVRGAQVRCTQISCSRQTNVEFICHKPLSSDPQVHFHCSYSTCRPMWRRSGQFSPRSWQLKKTRKSFSPPLPRKLFSPSLNGYLKYTYKIFICSGLHISATLTGFEPVLIALSVVTYV